MQSTFVVHNNCKAKHISVRSQSTSQQILQQSSVARKASVERFCLRAGSLTVLASDYHEVKKSIMVVCDLRLRNLINFGGGSQ